MSLALLARRSSVNMTRAVAFRRQLFSIQSEINQEGGRRKEEVRSFLEITNIFIHYLIFARTIA